MKQNPIMSALHIDRLNEKQGQKIENICIEIYG